MTAKYLCLADKLYSDLDTILREAEKNGTTARLKDVAIYFSAEELTVMRDALNEASEKVLEAMRKERAKNVAEGRDGIGTER